MIALPCEIVKCADGKGFWTYTPFAQTYLLNKRQMQCETVLTDGRTIRPKQRAHIYATLRDISAWRPGGDQGRDEVRVHSENRL